MKYKVALVITCTLAFVVATVALAGYTGPDRETTKTVRDPEHDKWTLIMDNPPLGCYSVCVIYHTCDEHPSVDRQEAVCCGVGTGWKADSSSCEMAFKTVTVKLPPAIVSGSFNCGLPGVNGWCRGSPKLDLNAIEPLAGEVIIYIEGSPGVLCNPPDNPSIACEWTNGGEGSYPVSYWAVSSYGDTSEQASDTWRADTVPPNVNLGRSGGTLGGGGWYLAGPVVLSVSGSDATSGIESVGLSIDGGSWLGSGQVTGDGIHAVETQARDFAGNVGGGAETVKIDGATPSIGISKSGPVGKNGWFVGKPVRVEASASDPLSGVARVENMIDGGSWSAGSTVNVTVEGVRGVSFRAVDVAGNDAIQSTQIKIDTVPPEVNLGRSGGTLGGGGWYLAGLVVLSVSGSDATSGIESVGLSIDGGSWLPSGQVTGDGIHTVESQAHDFAGNVGGGAETVKIDGAAPSIGISKTGTVGQNGWFVGKPVRVEASAADPLSGVAWVESRLDGGAWNTGGLLYVTNEGVHWVSFRAQDVAGNEALQSTQIKIDTVPPEVNLGRSGGMLGGSGWYLAGPVVLSVSGSDATSGIESVGLSIDGGSWLPSGQVAGDGIHSVEIRGRDFAGNVGGGAETVKIDGAAPSIGISKTGTVGQNGWFVGEPVRVEASAADPLSGVAWVESRLDGSAWNTGGLLYVTNEGIHGVTFRAQDVAGNEVLQSTQVRIDTVSPLTRFTNPADGSEIWVSGELTLRGTSTDATSGVSFADLSLNGGETWQGLDVEGDSWSSTWDTSSVPDGTYLVLARAQDVAGNVEATARITVHVENSQPTPILPSPTTNFTVTSTIPAPPTAVASPTAQSTPTSVPPTEINLVPTATNPPQVAIVRVEPTSGLTDTTGETPRTRTMGISLRIPWLWPALALIALMTAIGSSKLVDPRPRILRQIREDLESIRESEH